MYIHNQGTLTIRIRLKLSCRLALLSIVLRSPLDGTQCPHRDEKSEPTLVCSSPLENVAYEFVLISPSCFARLTWMVCEMGDKWPCSCCFQGCYFQDLLKISFSLCVFFFNVFRYSPSGANIQYY